MARYFFHVHDSIVVRDEQGVELPDLEAAATLAVTAAREIASEQVKAGSLDLEHRIHVADRDGMVLHTVTFRDAVAVCGVSS